MLQWALIQYSAFLYACWIDLLAVVQYTWAIFTGSNQSRNFDLISSSSSLKLPGRLHSNVAMPYSSTYRNTALSFATIAVQFVHQPTNLRKYPAMDESINATRASSIKQQDAEQGNTSPTPLNLWHLVVKIGKSSPLPEDGMLALRQKLSRTHMENQESTVSRISERFGQLQLDRRSCFY